MANRRVRLFKRSVEVQPQYSTYNLVPLEHYKFKSVWVLTPSSKLSMECELREAYNFSKYIYV